MGTRFHGLSALVSLFFLFLLAPLFAQEGAPVSAAPAAATGAEEDSLDVTITGEAKDEIPIAKDPPPLDVPFDKVVTLSRDGQRDQVLNEPVEYMTPADYNKLVLLNSRQTSSPLSMQLPSPPFFRMELPTGVTSQVWEFRVVDQANQAIKTMEGLRLPEGFVEWDGYEGGLCKVRVGPSYSPVLTLTDEAGTKRRYFGEAVQMDAIQYPQDGLLHLEFNNDRLYERDAADFSREMEAMLQASLELMRQRAGTPLRVIVYDNPAANALTQKRLDRWKKLLLSELLISPDDLTLATLSPKDRGRVTAVMMLEKAQ
jgi:hypothetical protein